MPKTIISDTSCLIVLSKIGSLDLLRQIYGTVITTPEVAGEYGAPLPDWIEIKEAINTHYQQLLELQVDKGEASAIALAIETPESSLILDDYKARKIAEKIGLKITGTIGVIIKAKLDGIIPSVKPYLRQIKETDFRMSDELINKGLIEAKEE